MVLPEVPIEIVEIILSHLASDIASLARCSLVDRAWLSLCRQWQFKDADLTGYRMTSRHARFHKFMDLFERSEPTAPCTLSRYIQGLKINATFTPYQISGLDTLELPNLRSIRIEPFSDSVPTYLLSSISITFSEKIHRLDVPFVTFPSHAALLEFICAFPNLQELSIGDNAFAEWAWRPPATSAQLSSHITSLKLYQRLGTTREEMIHWFVGQIQTSSIQIKQYVAADHVMCSTDVLAAVANTVEELVVELFSTVGGGVEGLLNIDARFPHLRTLHLLWHSTPDWKDMDIALGMVLSSLDAPALSTLSVSVPHHSVEATCSIHALEGARLGKLDDTLTCTTRASTPSLRTVEFLLHYCGGRPKDQERCTNDAGNFEGKLWGENPSKQAEPNYEDEDTFEKLAFQFLQTAAPKTLRQQEIRLLVSQIVK